MSQLLSAAQAVDALWDEPDPASEDERDGLIWMTDDEQAMAAALRGLRAALVELMDVSGGEPERYLAMVDETAEGELARLRRIEKAARETPIKSSYLLDALSTQASDSPENRDG